MVARLAPYESLRAFEASMPTSPFTPMGGTAPSAGALVQALLVASEPF
jgi:hypothetical protein